MRGQISCSSSWICLSRAFLETLHEHEPLLPRRRPLADPLDQLLGFQDFAVMPLGHAASFSSAASRATGP